MFRMAPMIGEQDLERAMLRKSVAALTTDMSRCADCARAPLIGETLYVYGDGVKVCELCRPLRRDQPDGSEPVRNSEYGQAVRIHRLTPS